MLFPRVILGWRFSTGACTRSLTSHVFGGIRSASSIDRQISFYLGVGLSLPHIIGAHKLKYNGCIAAASSASSPLPLLLVVSA